ncbi:hypothetical protein D3C83_67870 [compost metagenome]
MLWTAFSALGKALSPWVDTFGATIVVVGGSMAGSWDLVAEPLRSGLGEVALVRSRLGDAAPLVGAGLWALR